jgi:hypothetical protein
MTNEDRNIALIDTTTDQLVAEYVARRRGKRGRFELRRLGDAVIENELRRRWLAQRQPLGQHA